MLEAFAAARGMKVAEMNVLATKSSNIHSRSRDLKIKERQVFGEKHMLRVYFPPEHASCSCMGKSFSLRPH